MVDRKHVYLSELSCWHVRESALRWAHFPWHVSKKAWPSGHIFYPPPLKACQGALPLGIIVRFQAQWTLFEAHVCWNVFSSAKDLFIFIIRWKHIFWNVFWSTPSLFPRFIFAIKLLNYSILRHKQFFLRVVLWVVFSFLWITIWIFSVLNI